MNNSAIIETIQEKKCTIFPQCSTWNYPTAEDHKKSRILKWENCNKGS